MAKLTNAQRNRILARDLFVNSEYSKTKIAETLGVSTKTIENYQSQDKKDGNDWLTLRASKHIKNTQENKENMYSLFTGYMMDSLKEIRENEKLSADAKAQMIVSLGDSFSKMGKIARQEDPEAYKLGVIKVTIEKILTALKTELSVESMQKVIEVIFEIQDDIADVTI
ncbi:DUF1804 family protein [Malaciobacter marinus]|uniref:DUF1804 family protein n=1 Tax=Malaciobacter marinus TaxID=505249 RepID=UPI003B004BD8